MPRPSLGNTARTELISLWNKSGRNIEIASSKLKLDQDTAAEIIDNARRGHVPVIGKGAQTELLALIRGSRELGEGRLVAPELNKKIGDEYVMRWYQLDQKHHVPKAVMNKAQRVTIVVHGKLNGKDKYITHTAAGDMKSAWAMMARVIKDYRGRFIADADGFTVKVFQWIGD